jgi:hypothetical protein
MQSAKSPLARKGIEAEILFCGKAAKKIAAESPVFCGFTAKNAQWVFEKGKRRCPDYVCA